MTIDVIEVKRRLQVLLNDQNLVNDYIRQFGPTIDIKHIKEIKEKRESNTRTENVDESVGQDPVYQIQVKCPVCNQTKIECNELRAKSQQIIPNKFLIPTYFGASGFKTVDYNMIAVTVCPRCLFASPDKKDFCRIGTSGPSENKSQIAHSILMTLQEKIGERKALLGTITDYENYFKRPRSDESAINSYKLAIARAKAEAWYEQPYSSYKLGAYTLKIAKILKDSGKENKDQIMEALGYFEEAFRTSNCPSEDIEMQVIYTIVALNIKLSEFKKANSFLAVFTNLINARTAEMRENPKLNTVTIEKWADRAKFLWEERENPDLFKDE
ncbi:MAG TPA: DUF2225 domain-containing protein [Chitinispirillaceae bacterium]|nr:DUF2225 domain-containing protein [Chitinispirillaceae bacterium]